VVVTGGDGTIDNVASSPPGKCTSVGVVQRGTFNCFVRFHGISFDAPSGIGMLLNAQAHPVQVGKVNERAFLVNASPGMPRDLLEAQVNAMRAMKRCETAGKYCRRLRLPCRIARLPDAGAGQTGSALTPHAGRRLATATATAANRHATSQSLTALAATAASCSA